MSIQKDLRNSLHEIASRQNQIICNKLYHTVREKLFVVANGYYFSCILNIVSSEDIRSRLISESIREDDIILLVGLNVRIIKLLTDQLEKEGLSVKQELLGINNNISRVTLTISWE